MGVNPTSIAELHFPEVIIDTALFSEKNVFCDCFARFKLAKTFILKLKRSAFIRNTSFTESWKGRLKNWVSGYWYRPDTEQHTVTQLRFKVCVITASPENLLREGNYVSHELLIAWRVPLFGLATTRSNGEWSAILSSKMPGFCRSVSTSLQPVVWVLWSDETKYIFLT